MLEIHCLSGPVIASTRMPGSGTMKMKYSSGNQATRIADVPLHQQQRAGDDERLRAELENRDVSNTRPTT